MVTHGDYDELIRIRDGTFFGDADLDHEVGFADYLSLSASFGAPGGWGEGDFDADGQVSFADFLLLSTNFGMLASAVDIERSVSDVRYDAYELVIDALLGSSRYSERKARH